MIEQAKKLPGWLANQIKDKYPLQALYRLFAICAFPIHAWAILMILNDVGWIEVRLELFDTIGYAAYVLLFSLAESLLIFIFVLALSLPGSLVWPREKLHALSGGLYLNAALAGFITQVYLFYKEIHPNLDKQILKSLPFSDRLDQILILLAAGLVVFVPVLVQAYYVPRSEKFTTWMNDMLEKIVILSSVYLGLDVLAILLIIARNLFGETIRDLL